MENALWARRIPYQWFERNKNERNDAQADVGQNMDDLMCACLNPSPHDPIGDFTSEANDFHKLIKEWRISFYEGCKDYSKLEFIMMFYEIKSRRKMSDKNF